jgi:hypothetical protein
VNRKTFVTTLGAAGFGFVAAAHQAPLVLAQEESTKDENTDDAEQPFEEALAHRKEVYAQFTADLAKELGVADGDKVDAAIRKAMMSVIDAQVTDQHLTYGQAEALKTLVATADVPIAPGFIHGPMMASFVHDRMEGNGPAFGDHFFVRPGEKGGPIVDRIIEQCTDPSKSGG